MFLHTEALKYPKATVCLQKNRKARYTFYAFPAAQGPGCGI
jgi:hypothetical protein